MHACTHARMHTYMHTHAQTHSHMHTKYVSFHIYVVLSTELVVSCKSQQFLSISPPPHALRLDLVFIRASSKQLLWDTVSVLQSSLT